MTLPEDLDQQVTVLSEAGNALAESGEFTQAIGKYVAALELLPEPVNDWEAATWLLAAIGDAHFLSGNHEHARRALSDAMHCPGAIGNPFLHLRLGQAQMELGNTDRAADELARAYMGAGAEIFGDEDPKYFAFLKTVLQPPPDGQW
jgi:tetratricopeptide (TPR) repeat protein